MAGARAWKVRWIPLRGTPLRAALRVHSLSTPSAFGWKAKNAFHTAHSHRGVISMWIELLCLEPKEKNSACENVSPTLALASHHPDNCTGLPTRNDEGPEKRIEGFTQDSGKIECQGFILQLLGWLPEGCFWQRLLGEKTRPPLEKDPKDFLSGPSGT